jgi:surface protein
MYARVYAHVSACTRVCARMCVHAFGHARVPHCLRALRAAVDLRVVGSQTFEGASAFNADISKWNTAPLSTMERVCAVFHTDIHMHISTSVRVSTRVSTRASWRMCVSVCLGAHVTALHLRAPRATVDLRVLGSQAFFSATAFNANIGAWNTASVTNMFWVCAVFHQIFTCAHRRARAHLCVRFGAHASAPRFRALRAAANFRVVGSQAFFSATAFNANIGAWNTASVTNMHEVMPLRQDVCIRIDR